MRRRAALVTALLFVLVAAFAVQRARERGDGVTPHAGEVTGEPVPRRAVHRYALGSELTYTLAYESDGTMDVGGGGGEARLSSRLRARLVRTVVAEAESGHHLVLYRFLDADVILAVNESNAASAASDVASALAEGVLADEAPDGRVVSMRASSTASSLALSFARTLLSGLQVTLPERWSPAWNARESDTNGDYLASYAVVAEPSPAKGVLALKKTQRAARSAATPEHGDWAGVTRGEARTTGATEIDFDLERGATKELASEQSIESMLGTLRVATTRTKLDAERTGERTLDAPALATLLASIAALRASEPAPLSTRSSIDGEATKLQASRHWLGRATLPDLVLALRASEGRTQDDRHFDLFLKLHALTYLRPDECARVARLLPGLDPSRSSFQVVLAALGATGSNEAQASLVALLRAPETSSDAKKQLIATLGMLTLPGDDAQAALRTVRDHSPVPELADTAALSLGIMARSLASRSPARANAIVEDALTRARADENDEPRLRLDLSILGNTASPRIEHDVLGWSRSASAPIRQQAAFALRFVRSDAAEARLLELLAGDDDPALRSRVASALSYRDASAHGLDVQRARASADSDPGVRATLLGNLYAMREVHPEVIAVLEERRRADADPKVRQIADTLLGSAVRDD
jgi:hypothetical protein